MTSYEAEILEVIRESLPQLGAQCDALTGDGLLARPMHESASPLETVLQVLQAEVNYNSFHRVRTVMTTVGFMAVSRLTRLAANGQTWPQWPALHLVILGSGSSRPRSYICRGMGAATLYRVATTLRQLYVNFPLWHREARRGGGLVVFFDSSTALWTALPTRN